MNKILIIVALMTGGIPIIALTDYAIFGKMLRLIRCENCDADNSHWYTWFIACVLESLFFISGLMLGVSLS